MGFVHIHMYVHVFNYNLKFVLSTFPLSGSPFNLTYFLSGLEHMLLCLFHGAYYLINLCIRQNYFISILTPGKFSSVQWLYDSVQGAFFPQV